MVGYALSIFFIFIVVFFNTFFFTFKIKVLAEWAYILQFYFTMQIHVFADQAVRNSLESLNI